MSEAYDAYHGESQERSQVNAKTKHSLDRWTKERNFEAYIVVSRTGYRVFGLNNISNLNIAAKGTLKYSN
jgi:hypothetical protein